MRPGPLFDFRSTHCLEASAQAHAVDPAERVPREGVVAQRNASFRSIIIGEVLDRELQLGFDRGQIEIIGQVDVVLLVARDVPTEVGATEIGGLAELLAVAALVADPRQYT